MISSSIPHSKMYPYCRVVQHQLSKFLAVPSYTIMAGTSYIQWNDNDVHFVLNQVLG
jgi:hypothetical protein